MNKFDSYIKKFQKVGNDDTGRSTSKTVNKAPLKNRETSKSIKKLNNEKVEEGKTASGNIKNEQMMKKQNLLNANLKLIINGDRGKEKQNNLQKATEKRETRSASKSQKKMKISSDKQPGAVNLKKSKISKSLNRIKTQEAAKKVNMQENNKASNKPKKEFLPKASFLLNKRLKFKKIAASLGKKYKNEESEKINEENEMEEKRQNSNSGEKRLSSSKKKKSRAVEENISMEDLEEETKEKEENSLAKLNDNQEKKKTKKELAKEEAENIYKNRYNVVKSKVKEMLKLQNETFEEKLKRGKSVNKKAKEKNKNEKVEKDPIPVKQKSSSVGKNFVRMNLKQGYVQKTRIKHKTVRRMKIDNNKKFDKYQNKKMNSIDHKYLGKGKFGLDDEVEEENGSEDEIIGKGTTSKSIISNTKGSVGKSNSSNKIGANSDIKDTQAALPHFSEGYYNNLIEETKLLSQSKENPSNSKVFSNTDNNLNSNENLNNAIPASDSKNEITSNIKPKIPGVTPDKILTNKLTSALKSSLNKNVSLDTELRILSKEFRFLLSGKKIEAEELRIRRETVEKKLNFNEEEKKKSKSGMIIEESSEEEEKILDNESVHENLPEEEVEKLENDILLKVLEENFGFNDFLPGQLQVIKNLLNHKNTLAILPPAGGKSLCFQLPALVSEGLTIVVSPLLSLITDQISNLPECLSGACLSSFTSQQQRNEIFNAIRNNKIKILFTTPERFAVENLSEIDEISLICFDEAGCACPLATNYRSAYVSVQNIVTKLKPNAMLFLSNNLTKLMEENLTQQYKIDSVIKEKITLPEKVKIFVSKEEKKLEGLIKLLRASHLRNIGPTLIFCNLKKNVDKVTSYLNQSGFSASSYHSGKADLERQMIQANFMTDKIKLVVCTMAFSMGISKNDIRLVILFDMPPSIEHFLQQVGRGGRDKKDTYVYILLNDEDYFTQRNMIYSENVDKSQILKFLEHFTHLVNKTSSFKSHKRNFGEAFESRPNLAFSNELNLPKTISLNFTNAQEFSGVKKHTQLHLMLSLINELDNINSKTTEENQMKMTCLGLGPSVLNIRFYKSTPEKLADNEPNIKLILECAREYQGNHRFNTLEACEKIGITYTDLLSYLYHLQSNGEISYEVKEEGLFLVIEKVPDSLKEIIKFMADKIQYLINLNLTKLNAAYIFLRKFAMNSLDNAINANISLKNPEKNTLIKCLTTYSVYSQYENDLKSLFEKYFEIQDGDTEIAMAGNSGEVSIILPIMIIETQREKTAIVKDIDEMIRKELEKNINLNSVEAVNILFGIHGGAEGKNVYFSNPLWSKFQQHDYNFIYEVVENSLLKQKPEIISKGALASKKMKTN